MSSKTATEAPTAENTWASNMTTFVGRTAGGIRVTSANPTPPGPIEMTSLLTTTVFSAAPGPMPKEDPPTTAIPFPTCTDTPSIIVSVGLSMKIPPFLVEIVRTVAGAPLLGIEVVCDCDDIVVGGINWVQTRALDVEEVAYTCTVCFGVSPPPGNAGAVLVVNTVTGFLDVIITVVSRAIGLINVEAEFG